MFVMGRIRIALEIQGDVVHQIEAALNSLSSVSASGGTTTVPTGVSLPCAHLGSTDVGAQGERQAAGEGWWPRTFEGNDIGVLAITKEELLTAGLGETGFHSG